MNTVDPRHVSRAIALQQLFSEFFAQKEPIEIEELLAELEVEEYDINLYKKLRAGVLESYQTIDPVIQKLAPAWPLNQIAPVDLIIIRMGIWEAFVSGTTPDKVVINEMIELAKEFGGETSPSFVNGVLGKLINNPDLQSELKQNNE